MNEANLINLAQQGDEAAWEALVRLYQQPVFRLAYLLIGDADEADDLAQETFIHAYRSFRQYDQLRPLRPWLLRITTNLAHNRRRSVRRYLAALSRSWLGAPEPATTLDEQAGDAWEAQIVWRAVQRLSPTDQEIIYLRYFLELNEMETALALAIAQGTVKSRLSRALSRLRVVVDQEFPALREGREA